MTEPTPEYHINEQTGIEWRHGDMPLFSYVPFRSLERFENFLRFTQAGLPVALEDDDGVIAGIDKAGPLPAWMEPEIPDVHQMLTSHLSQLSAAAMREMLGEKPIMTFRQEDNLLLPQFRITGVHDDGRRYTAAFNRMLQEYVRRSEGTLNEIAPGVFAPASGIKGPDATLLDLIAADKLNYEDDKLLAELDRQFTDNPDQPE